MGLTFLTPLMLGGAVLIAAPIILHLIMKKQPKHYMFPALRFLKERENSTRRTLNLRHILLLIARCLVIFLLAMALARPSLSSASIFGDQDAPISAAVIVDTSPRMDYRNDNQTRLAVAQEIGDWLLSQLPQESEVAIMESSTMVSDFAVDLSVAKQRLSTLKLNSITQSMPDMLDAAIRLLKAGERKERKEIYFFTDLSNSAWPVSATDRVQAIRKQHEDVVIYLIDVGVLEPRDAALGDLRFNSQTLPKDGSLEIDSQVTRFGRSDEASEIAIYIVDENGSPQKRGQISRKPADGQSETVQFRIPKLDLGTHQGIVRILSDDALMADNTRSFTVEVRNGWPVLIAAPDPADAYAYFLRPALESRFDCKVVKLDQLNKLDLATYSAICLLDPTPLDQPTAEKLQKYVEDGGGLAVWLGHNAELARFNDGALRKLMPGKLALQWNAGTRSLFLAPADLSHPVLSGFRSVQSEIPWVDFFVLRHWQFGELDPGVTTVIPFSGRDRLPALLEKPLGKGKILCMTTPISENDSDTDKWNTFATGINNWPPFVLVNGMMHYLVGNQDERFNYFPGEEAVFRIPDAQRNLSYTLTNPVGDTLAQTVDTVKGTAQIGNTNYPGNYVLRAGGTVGGVKRGFSVNTPAREFDLTRLNKEQLDKMLGPDSYKLARTKDEIDRTVSISRTGTEMFPFLVIVVAVVLGLEHYLSNKFYRRDDSMAKKELKSLSTFTT